MGTCGCFFHLNALVVIHLAVTRANLDTNGSCFQVILAEVVGSAGLLLCGQVAAHASDVLKGTFVSARPITVCWIIDQRMVTLLDRVRAVTVVAMGALVLRRVVAAQLGKGLWTPPMMSADS